MSIMSKTSGHAVQEALDLAVANLEAMRLAEGEALGRDIPIKRNSPHRGMAGGRSKAASPPSSSTTAKIGGPHQPIVPADVEIAPACGLPQEKWWFFTERSEKRH